MALIITTEGRQEEIDLHLDAEIEKWGETPLPYSMLRLRTVLGDYYEAQRLDDGRILLSSDQSDNHGVQVLLTQEESRLVLTDNERDAKLLEREDESTAYVNKMTLSDIVPGGSEYSSSHAISQVLSSNLYGSELLVALLLAEKMEPRKAMRRAGCSALVFVSIINRLRENGVFSNWC